MGWIWAALSGLIFSKGGAWVAGILASLGLGLATHQVVFTPALEYVQTAFNGLPANAAAWVAHLKLDVYISVVASAYAGASVKRVLLRKIGA